MSWEGKWSSLEDPREKEPSVHWCLERMEELLTRLHEAEEYIEAGALGSKGKSQTIVVIGSFGPLLSRLAQYVGRDFETCAEEAVDHMEREINSGG